MPLSARDQFKTAYISRCIEDGLTADQMLTRVKEAREKLAIVSELLGKAMDVGHGVAGAVASYGIPLALAAPPILGGMAGYGLARATDINDTDIAEIKNREIIDELNRQSERLKREKAMRDSMRAVPAGGRY